MNNSPVILILRCIGCCAPRPNGNPGPCAGDPSKCSSCPTDPVTLPIDNYLLVLLIIAIMYGVWFFNKKTFRNFLNIFLIYLLSFKKK